MQRFHYFLHTLTTVKFGSVQKPWTTFNVKYILDHVHCLIQRIKLSSLWTTGARWRNKANCCFSGFLIEPEASMYSWSRCFHLRQLSATFSCIFIGKGGLNKFILGKICVLQTVFELFHFWHHAIFNDRPHDKVVFVSYGWFGRNLLLFIAGSFFSFLPWNTEKMNNARDSLPSRIRNCSCIKITIHFFDKRYNLTLTFTFHVDHTAILDNKNSKKIQLPEIFAYVQPFCRKPPWEAARVQVTLGSLIAQWKPTLMRQQRKLQKGEELSVFQ